MRVTLIEVHLRADNRSGSETDSYSKYKISVFNKKKFLLWSVSFHLFETVYLPALFYLIVFARFFVGI